MSLTPITRARAAALLTSGVAFWASATRAQTEANAMIRIAVLPFESDAEAFYAKDMGFFATAGLNAQIEMQEISSAVAAAIASNAVDVGYITVDTIANIHQKKIPLVVIAPAAEFVSPTTTGLAALMVSIDSPIQRPQDLNGKIVAVAALHSIGETAVRALIDANGGDSSTVRFVEVPIQATAAALDAGRVDAAHVSEPFIGFARKTGRILAYDYEAIAKRFLLGGWCTTLQWAQSNPELVSRFAGVIRKTALWANENPVKSGAILAQYTKVDQALISTMTRVRYAEQLTPAVMQPLIDVSAKYNGFATFPARDLIFVPQ
jgi:NitT/TauT family transport system substrate-binding protein